MVSYMSDAEYYVGLIKRPVDPHKWFLLRSGYNVNGYGGLKGRAFNELMKLCFSRAELFSFTSMQNPKYQRHPVLEELEELRIGTIQTAAGLDITASSRKYMCPFSGRKRPRAT